MTRSRRRNQNRPRRRSTRKRGRGNGASLYLSRRVNVPHDPPQTGRAFWRRVRKIVPVDVIVPDGQQTATAVIKTTDTPFYNVVLAEFQVSRILALRTRTLKLYGPVEMELTGSVDMQVSNLAGTIFIGHDDPGRNHRSGVGCDIPAAHQLDEQVATIQYWSNAKTTAFDGLVAPCRVEFIGDVYVASPAPPPSIPSMEAEPSPAMKKLRENVWSSLRQGEFVSGMSCEFRQMLEHIRPDEPRANKS